MRRGSLAVSAVIVGAIAVAVAVGAHGQPAPAAKAPQLTASQVLANVEAAYKQPKQLTASYVQTVFNSTFGASKTTTGVLSVAKPDQFRFEYAPTARQKQGKSFIFDGTDLWIVEPANLQILKKPTQAGQLSIAITDG